MDQKKLEEKLLEACLTLETWYHGQLQDRAALRMLRAQLMPVWDQLNAETEAIVEGKTD